MNTPKLRFKGFTDDWEQRKVSDLLQERNEQAPRSEEYPLMAFIADQGVAPKGERYDRSALVNDENGKKYKRTEYGDFIYSSNNLETGSIGLNKYGNASISPVYSIFKKTSNVDLDFLGRRFLRKDFINEMVKWRQGVVYGQWKIHESDFLKINVVVPSIEEQKRIGHCFEKLDHLITLHQRKCDETKQLKKFMLQKMFPKNGEKNPEIRFEGFTDAWEQRKLDTVAKFSKGSGYSKGDLIETGTPIILYGRLYTKYETSISDVDTYVEAKEGSVYSKGGEVIVPASGETAEDIARAATVDKSGILLGGDLNVVMPNEDINSAFLAISISNGNSQRELAKKAQGKSVVHIHNEEIRNLIVPFPIKAEQNRIVDYFSTLDHLITLHQRKCEKLKALKKFMLQNMFI